MPFQLRIYTINRNKLNDFADAWYRGVYTLRLKMDYTIPLAWKIPETNQFVWLLGYDGPETWEDKERAYYTSPERAAIDPDPAQWIAKPEQYFVHSVKWRAGPLPATLQMRRYTINRGKLEAFTQLWHEQIASLREKVGFTLPGAWTVPETNQFIWLMGYEGPEDWESMDRAYFEAPERAVMKPNPAELIAKSEQVFVETLEI